MSIQLDFSGEIVLVSGGATGLGFATARAFGLHGATVALNDLTEDRVEAACERLRQESIACRGYVADVRDAGAVSALVTTLEDELGAPRCRRRKCGSLPQHTLPRDVRDRMGPGHRHQSQGGLPHLPGRGAIDGPSRQSGADHRRQLDRRATSHLGLVTLLHIQGSHGHADERDGAGAGKARHPRQCRASGVHRRRGWRPSTSPSPTGKERAAPPHSGAPGRRKTWRGAC